MFSLIGWINPHAKRNSKKQEDAGGVNERSINNLTTENTINKLFAYSKEEMNLSTNTHIKARNNYSKEEYFRCFKPWRKHPKVRHYEVIYAPIKSPFTANHV